MRKRTLVSVCALLAALAPLSAEFPGFFMGDSGVFTLNPLYDGIIAGGGAALTAGTFVADKISEPGGHDGKVLDLSCVNPVDRWAARPYSKALHVTGTVTEALAMAAPAVLVLADKSEWGVAAVMYAESVLWANGLKELAKNIVHRERPYMYFENPPQGKIEDGDFERSFPSGHTTMAFNGAVFASYVFSKYFPGSKLRLPVIAGSLTLAAATAVQRVLSGNHFVTDVLAGALLGSFTGFLVPFLHTLPTRNERLGVAVLPTGFAVTCRL